MYYMDNYDFSGVKKNLCTRVDAITFGQSWQVPATSIFQEIPLKKPNILE